jgi:hypothetical protein
LSISDYTLGGRNSSGLDWIHLKFTLTSEVQRGLRQDVYLWLLFFLFLAFHEFNPENGIIPSFSFFSFIMKFLHELKGEQQTASGTAKTSEEANTTTGSQAAVPDKTGSSPDSAEESDSEEKDTSSPQDSLSVVFSCALYRLHNQSDQELIWLHYFHYHCLKGIPTGYDFFALLPPSFMFLTIPSALLSLLERYLSEQGWNETSDGKLPSLLTRGLIDKVPALPSRLQLKVTNQCSYFPNKTRRSCQIYW